MNKSSLWWLLILLTAFIIFSPSVLTYFVQDDFWLLSISKVTIFADIPKLFMPESQVVWYRPISSQVFFAIGQWLFGLNPVPYHAIVFITHFFTAWFLYRFLLIFKQSREVGWCAALVYVTHQVHTISLSWLAAYSFIIGPLLILLTLQLFLQKKYIWALFTGILGMMTNEVNLLVLLFLLPFAYFDSSNNRRKNWSLFAVFLLLGGLIVYVRKVIFPTTITTELYQFHVSSSILSTFKFYALRLIGVPLLFDEMSFISQAIALSLVILFVGIVGWGVYMSWQKEKRFLILLLYLTFVGLLPFLFLPDHLAPHYLSFSLLSFSALVAISFQKIVKIHDLVFYIGIGVFLIIQLMGSRWIYTTHWLFTRAELAKKLVSQEKYEYPAGTEEYYSLGANAAIQVFTKK